MRYYVHTDEDGRIDGTMPEFNVNYSIDESTGESVEVETPNVTEGDIELGWFEWPFEDPIPEGFWDYGIVDGKLVNLGPKPPSEEQLRAAEVAEAHDELPEIQAGLLEVAEMTANNEVSLEEVVDALMELAALIGGNDG